MSRVERERRVSMRLHRGAPPNIGDVRAVDPSGRLSAMMMSHGLPSSTGLQAPTAAVRRSSGLKTDVDVLRTSSSKHIKK
jgi:hypothetical protein